MANAAAETVEELGEKEALILDAVATVLAKGGIAAVSMRAVAKEAGVALGLMNYYFDDKESLIAAALRRIGRADLDLVAPAPGLDPTQQLRASLRQVVDPQYLATDYLGLRLQLWALAPIDPVFAEINQNAQREYRAGLSALLAAARPDLSDTEVARRANDILVIQNGMWLTSLQLDEHDAIARGIARCEAIVFEAAPNAEGR